MPKMKVVGVQTADGFDIKVVVHHTSLLDDLRARGGEASAPLVA
jgi:hypothetical protein